MSFDFDLFVIGGGSGGVRSGRLAAAAGYKVGLAEEHRMGGTCVIRGCVPKKLMVYASGFSEAFEDAQGFGWTVGERSFDWAKLIAAKDKEIDRLEAAYARNLGASGATQFDARAELVDAHTVQLSSGEKFTAKHILIAVGGTPFVPDIEGSEHAITSNDIFDLKEMPARTLVVGGGYIASEFAGILNGLGSKVTQFYRGEQILRGFDQEVADFVAAEMVKKGVDIRTRHDVEKIEKVDGALQVTAKNGDTVMVDAVLYATGRVPAVRGLGLERVGVETGKSGVIKVDAYSQTNIPSIYAVGDVTNRANLTPVAIHEGVCFVETVFQGNPTQPDHALIPTAVFTQPEIGTVGMGEEEASKTGKIDVYVAEFKPMMHTLAGKEERMLMKMIVAQESQKVLGVHIVGHAAGEMIQMAGIAVKMGATKADFDATMAVHPTASEELVTLKAPTRST